MLEEVRTSYEKDEGPNRQAEFTAEDLIKAQPLNPYFKLEFSKLSNVKRSTLAEHALESDR